jgi:hypothetical protein
MDTIGALLAVAVATAIIAVAGCYAEAAVNGYLDRRAARRTDTHTDTHAHAH